MSTFAKEVTKILSEIKHGNQDRFKELFDMTALHLRGIARAYLVNKNLDEDAVSEAFIRLMTYIHTFKPDQDGYNWMCRIVQRCAYDLNNAERKNVKAEKDYAKEQSAEYYESGFENVDFIMLMEKLKEPDRFILSQRICYGQTLEDIGKMLKISKVAIHQRLDKIYEIAKKFEKIG